MAGKVESNGQDVDESPSSGEAKVKKETERAVPQTSYEKTKGTGPVVFNLGSSPVFVGK